MSNTDTALPPFNIPKIVAWVVGVILVLILLFFAGFPTISRWNARQEREQHRTQALRDAKNEVTITNIRIGTTRQKVDIAKQEAAIRQQQAIGIREAQDEIAATLTPLYVQFEMTEALKQIAQSGRNSSVIYIPTGPNGLPLVAGAPSGALPTK